MKLCYDACLTHLRENRFCKIYECKHWLRFPICKVSDQNRNVWVLFYYLIFKFQWWKLVHSFQYRSNSEHFLVFQSSFTDCITIPKDKRVDFLITHPTAIMFSLQQGPLVWFGNIIFMTQLPLEYESQIGYILIAKVFFKWFKSFSFVDLAQFYTLDCYRCFILFNFVTEQLLHQNFLRGSFKNLVEFFSLSHVVFYLKRLTTNAFV